MDQMKPAIPVVSLLLLLLLASTTQGIRLDDETLAAFHNNIHEKGSSMGGVSQVAGVAPCGIDGHCSGRSRKLTNKNMDTIKNERSEGIVFVDASQSHHHPKEAMDSSGDQDLHVEPPFSKQPQTYPDTLDIAGMDYSPAKRKPPIHN